MTSRKQKNANTFALLTAAIVAATAATSARAQTWTYDANVLPDDPTATPSPFAPYVVGPAPTLGTEGPTNYLQVNSAPNNNGHYSFYTANPANWNVDPSTGYSYEWRARLDAAVPTNPSSALMLAGNNSNYSALRIYNNSGTGDSILLPLQAELQSGGGPSVTATLGNPFAWHTYRVDVQGTTHKLYVDNYPAPVATANLGASAANTFYFGDGTAGDNGKYQVDYVRTYQNGIVGAPARPSRTSITPTLFAAHFDGTTGNGGLNADYALGSPAVVANQIGGSIESPGKFGNGATRILGGNGVIQYQTAGNFNVSAGGVEMWIKPDAPISGEYQGLFGTFVNQGDIRLQITSSGQLQAYMAANGSAWSLTSAAGQFNDTDWHHVAWGWDFNVNKAAIYIDGVLVDDTAEFTNLPGLIGYNGVVDSSFQVGRIQNGSSRFLGQIDEFRISGADVFGGLSFTPENNPYVLPGAPQWAVNADGAFSNASNWVNGLPNGVDAVANFGAVIGQSRTVTLDAAGAPYTLGAINFANANSYTLTGNQTLTMDVSSGTAAVTVLQGNHTISAPLHLAKDTVIRVTPSTATLTVSGALTAASDATLIKAGAGTALVPHVRAGGLTVNAGTLRIPTAAGVSGASSVTALNINTAAGARLDITSNAIISSVPAGTASGGVYDGVQGFVQSARNGGAWDGAGLTTSLSAATTGLTSIGVITAAQKFGLTGDATVLFAGQTVTANSTLAMYTYGGDANLDGLISGDDYSAIDFNIATPGANGWANGDFNYDGIISGDDYSVIDFNIVAQGTPFPTSGIAGTVAVPEPTGVAVLAAAALATSLSRRRRRYA